jgi:hypothetical protein
MVNDMPVAETNLLNAWEKSSALVLQFTGRSVSLYSFAVQSWKTIGVITANSVVFDTSKESSIRAVYQVHLFKSLLSCL